MKKVLFFAVALFACVSIFAQEKIAVFPFEDLSQVFSQTEMTFFYRQFSNEFTNRNAGRFTIVPRSDVDRLINTEAAFQISDFSAREKTAEMNSVLNGTQILSGIIGRIGSNRIAVSVSLYTYPNLSQLPGGVDLTVTNSDELFDKIPELVQSMWEEIAEGLRRINPEPLPVVVQPQITPVVSPPSKASAFYDYTFFNGLTLFGYTYSPDKPLGFTLGAVGIYTSFGFAVPDWKNMEKNDEYTITDYETSPYTDQRYQIVNWVIGYNITIISNTLYLPIGVGLETVKGWRLQTIYTSDTGWYTDPKWNPAPQWETSFLFEAGLLLRIDTGYLSPYLTGTYRNIGINKHTFSIGIGGCVDFW